MVKDPSNNAVFRRTVLVILWYYQIFIGNYVLDLIENKQHTFWRGNLDAARTTPPYTLALFRRPKM